MTSASAVTTEMIESWAEDPLGPVALAFRETLISVEGTDAVVFPPTFAMPDSADTPYNIDTLSDGTKVCLIDSVGSQANRIEPIFKRADLQHLVPQIEITYGNEQVLSILDAGHRLGDAVVRCTELRPEVQEAFYTFQRSGDAAPIAKLAPTSLVFGVWDSRDTQAKLPRIVQSVIRAWDVEPLTRSAQYTPPVDYADPNLEIFSDEEKQKQEGNPKSPLAQRGFVHVPSVRQHGGVRVNGHILRTVTVNLVALRRLRCESDTVLRKYILGLSLVAAVEPVEAFLRQGCLLTPDPETPSIWEAVARDGRRTPVDLAPDTVREFATTAAKAFGVEGQRRRVAFDRDLARHDVGDAAKKKGGRAKSA